MSWGSSSRGNKTSSLEMRFRLKEEISRVWSGVESGRYVSKSMIFVRSGWRVFRFWWLWWFWILSERRFGVKGSKSDKSWKSKKPNSSTRSADPRNWNNSSIPIVNSTWSDSSYGTALRVKLWMVEGEARIALKVEYIEEDKDGSQEKVVRLDGRRRLESGRM